MANAVMFQRLKENIVAIGEELKTKNRESINMYLTQDREQTKGIYTKYKELIFNYTEKLKDAKDQGFVSNEEATMLSKMVFDKYNSLFQRVSNTIDFLTQERYTEDKILGAYYTIERIINNEYFDDQGLAEREKLEKFNERISIGIKTDDDKMNNYISNLINESILYSFRTMINYLDVKNIPFSKDLSQGLKKLLEEVKKENCYKIVIKILDETDMELCSRIIGEFDSFYKALNK